MITWTSIVRRLAETKGQLPGAVWRQLARETLERGAPVASRSAPLDFADIATRIETALSAAR